MSSDNNKKKDELELLLEEYFKRSSFDERLGDSLALEFEADTTSEAMSVEFIERATAVARRGSFDGWIARAKTRLKGSLGAFDTALVRIRESAKCTREQMAERAGVSVDLWVDLEGGRIALDSVDVTDLARVVEAVQLRKPEFRAAIKRSLNMRLVSRSQASFRSDRQGDFDSLAAYQDLLDVVNDDGEANRESSDAADLLSDRISDELQRRGRGDLL